VHNCRASVSDAIGLAPTARYLCQHRAVPQGVFTVAAVCDRRRLRDASGPAVIRSEEHTSELQSRFDLVCRLLLEKKKKIDIIVFELAHTLPIDLLCHIAQ